MRATALSEWVGKESGTASGSRWVCGKHQEELCQLRILTVSGCAFPPRASQPPARLVGAASGRGMNCRAEVLEVSVEGRQVEEALLAVLHTVLLHRSTGKFHYKKEGTYSIGTVGTQDIDCDFIDFTYVRVSSEELDRALRKVVGEFKVGQQLERWAFPLCLHTCPYHHLSIWVLMFGLVPTFFVQQRPISIH